MRQYNISCNKRYTRSGSYGADAGSVNLATGVSTTQGYALSVAELASHTHGQRGTTNTSGGTAGLQGSAGPSNLGISDVSGSTGSGNAHSHDIELRYTDVIVATKD